MTSNESNKVNKFIASCAWLVANENNDSVSDDEYASKVGEANAIKSELSLAQLSELYISGKVHARFCK